ncbi:FecR family protein [Methylomonas sp. 2BW1-5-20]|uniref:FecR family protein n=1 Tax=Methylomonas sp. 2BW1-5-20 TaxID=3376686 RepID=UPI0040508B70
MSAPETSANVNLQDQAIGWLVCLRDDSLSDEQLDAFADWLARDPSHAEALAAVENLFSDMVAAGSLLTAATPETPRPMAVCHAAKRPRPKVSRSAGPYRPWLAAGLGMAAVCLLAIGLIMPRQSLLFSDYLSDYRTQTGEIRDIQLSDGSRMLMNTNSAIYVDYTADVRRIVLLHGQVRFTVAKDGRRPFEVKTDELTVRALGTVFEVYKAAAEQTLVTVQEHTVAVLANKDSRRADSVTVAEGQGLSYKAGLPLPHPQAASLEQTAWQQHRLVINDRPLAELVSELERYRFGRIFLADAALKNLRVTGVFSLDTPDEALAAVGKALALREIRVGPWVLLHR